MGSSAAAPETLDLSAYGLISSDEAVNPDFHNFTKVFVWYCSGTGHQGYLRDPVRVKDRDLYFRGHNITLGVFAWVEQTYQALSSKDGAVVLSGDSAGGLATFLWADYLKEKVAGRFLAIPDSGYFNDEKHADGTYRYRAYMVSLAKLVNADVPLPNPQCAAYYPGD